MQINQLKLYNTLWQMRWRHDDNIFILGDQFYANEVKI
jgi:hypothetical protein